MCAARAAALFYSSRCAPPSMTRPHPGRHSRQAIGNAGHSTAGQTVRRLVSASRRYPACPVERQGLDSGHIHYIEAHGTGTEIGDPVRHERSRQYSRGANTGRLSVGSVKTIRPPRGARDRRFAENLLALENAMIPTELTCRQAPLLTGRPGAARQHTLTPWPVGDEPRRAGVSSFEWADDAHVSSRQARRSGQLSRLNVIDAPLAWVVSVVTEQALTNRRRTAGARHRRSRPDCGRCGCRGDTRSEFNIGRAGGCDREVLLARWRGAAGSRIGCCGGPGGTGQDGLRVSRPGHTVAGMGAALYRRISGVRAAAMRPAAILEGHMRLRCATGCGWHCRAGR